MAETQVIISEANLDPTLISVEKEIEQARQEIAKTAIQLQKRLRNNFNWRYIVERQPFTVVGIAVGIGALVGFATAPKSNPAPRLSISNSTEPNFWTPTITAAMTYAVREGSKYLFERILNEKKP